MATARSALKQRFRAWPLRSARLLPKPVLASPQLLQSKAAESDAAAQQQSARAPQPLQLRSSRRASIRMAESTHRRFGQRLRWLLCGFRGFRFQISLEALKASGRVQAEKASECKAVGMPYRPSFSKEERAILCEGPGGSGGSAPWRRTEGAEEHSLHFALLRCCALAGLPGGGVRASTVFSTAKPQALDFGLSRLPGRTKLKATATAMRHCELRELSQKRSQSLDLLPWQRGAATPRRDARQSRWLFLGLAWRMARSSKISSLPPGMA